MKRILTQVSFLPKSINPCEMTLGIKPYSTVVEIPELDVKGPESVTKYSIVLQGSAITGQLCWGDQHICIASSPPLSSTGCHLWYPTINSYADFPWLLIFILNLSREKRRSTRNNTSVNTEREKNVFPALQRLLN